MNVAGEFTSPAPPAALATLATDRSRLGAVAVLRDLVVDADTVRARFRPGSLFAGTTFDVAIRAGRVGPESAELHVVGRHGPHLVDVALRLGFVPAGSGSRVTWSAEVAVRGPMASVGQRVIRDLATRAIDEVLQQAAAAGVPRRPDVGGQQAGAPTAPRPT